MAFLTAAQFVQRYDVRRVGDWLKDDNTRATAADIANPVTTAGAIVALALEEASELIVAAGAVGKRYTRADLAGLVANTTATPSGYLLQRLTADLAFGLLVKRRALPHEETEALGPAYGEALAYLEALRRGDRIFFDVADVPEAGLPDHTDMHGPVPQFDCPRLMSSNVPFFGCQPGKNVPCC